MIVRAHGFWHATSTHGQHVWHWGTAALWWCAALAHLGGARTDFSPDPYGWLLLSKLVLYMLIVINGA